MLKDVHITDFGSDAFSEREEAFLLRSRSNCQTSLTRTGIFRIRDITLVGGEFQ